MSFQSQAPSLRGRAGGEASVRLYIFDLDGTLLDTLRDLATSVNYAMEQCHYPTHSIDKVRMMVGNGVATLIKRAVPSGTSEEDTAHALDIFKKHYMEHGEDTTQPYDGIHVLLELSLSLSQVIVSKSRVLGLCPRL